MRADHHFSCRPTADFLISYHPSYSNLFLATGGSGHAFKFFPVMGEKIVHAMEGCLEPELRELWRWREEGVERFEAADDGSRGGRKGMRLWDEVGGEKVGKVN